MANGYIPIQYPSWAYPASADEPPQVVANDAQLLAFVTAPLPPAPSAVPTSSTSMPPSVMLTLRKTPTVAFRGKKKES